MLNESANIFLMENIKYKIQDKCTVPKIIWISNWRPACHGWSMMQRLYGYTGTVCLDYEPNIVYE